MDRRIDPIVVPQPDVGRDERGRHLARPMAGEAPDPAPFLRRADEALARWRAAVAEWTSLPGPLAGAARNRRPL